MERKRGRQRIAWILVLTVCLSGSIPGQFTPTERSRQDYWEDFLQTARIIESHQMSSQQGITKPWVLTLEKDGIVRKALWKPIEGIHKGFHENWRWEIAAYQLDKYLGLNMIPPTVERRIGGSCGSLQLWVDSMMSMSEMNSKNTVVPQDKILSWNRTICLQRAFDNLIANEDRHQGNFLITSDWRIILIDHSRSFRTSSQFTEELIFAGSVSGGNRMMRQFPRAFFDRIKALDFESIKIAAGNYLTDREIEAVLMRRDLMIDEIDRIIGVYGPEDVLY